MKSITMFADVSLTFFNKSWPVILHKYCGIRHIFLEDQPHLVPENVLSFKLQHKNIICSVNHKAFMQEHLSII